MKANILILIILLGTLLSGCVQQEEKYTGSVDKITIAYAKEPLASLVLIAEEKGFFSHYGINVTIKKFKGGKQALTESLLRGEADMATTADVPIVANSFNHQNFRIVSVIGKSSNEPKIIARRNSGISRPEDLLGKRIGTKSSSAVHFFLHVFLLNHQISRSGVDLEFEVDGDELVKLLINGEIDALSHREPFISNAKEALGENAVLFEGEGFYTKTFNLVVTEEFIKNNSIVVEKVVKALVEAEDFVKNNRDESINIMAKEIGISKSDAENLWSEIDLIVYLDQSLLLSLDEVARWMINNNLTDSTEVPNYLDYIYIDALEEVKPEAVTIIR
jgi:sulfonate transport system substrate-binding protein